jgi:antitoxin MazE
MRTHLVKWGNSVAVRLPKAMLEAAQLRAGDTVELEAPETGGILVRAQKRWPSIEERIESITPETLHPETDTRPAVGNEFW